MASMESRKGRKKTDETEPASFIEEVRLADGTLLPLPALPPPAPQTTAAVVSHTEKVLAELLQDSEDEEDTIKESLRKMTPTKTPQDDESSDESSKPDSPIKKFNTRPKKSIAMDESFGDRRNGSDLESSEENFVPHTDEDEELDQHLKEANNKRPRSSSSSRTTPKQRSTRVSEQSTSPVPSQESKPRKPISDVWAMFTDDPTPYNKKLNKDFATCKNCGQQFRHHYKILSVQTHLRHCFPFQQIMKDLPAHKQPEWYRTKTICTSLGGTIDATTACMPTLTTTEQQQVDYHLAMHCYATSSSFTKLECQHLQTAFDILRPGVSIPSRKRLGGNLLDLCYNKTKRKVEEALKETPSYLCLTSDGWSNVNNDSIINYMIVAGEKTYFAESVDTKDTSHSGNFLSADIMRVAKPFAQKLCGVVMDNTKANKKAGALLEDKHKNWFTHGCVCHALNLLVKDIFTNKKPSLEKADATKVTEEIAFAALHSFSLECKDVVVFFKITQEVKARLEREQKKVHAPKLVLPASTRWGTLRGCFTSLAASYHILKTMVETPEFVAGTKKQKEKRAFIRDIILDKDFLNHVNLAIAMCNPIDKLIKKYQSDTVPLSEIYQDFVNLTVPYNNMDALDDDAKTFMRDAIMARYELMEGKAHRFANILDPRFLGDGMEPDELKEAEDELFVFPDENGKTNEARAKKLFVSYSAF